MKKILMLFGLILTALLLIIINCQQPSSSGGGGSSGEPPKSTLKVSKVSAKFNFTIALFNNGTVKCWGDNFFGQLGYEDTEARGNNPGEMGDALPTVDLGTGRTAVQIAAGGYHTVVLLDDGTVKCWGSNEDGRLGYGDTDSRGDNPGEMGDSLPVVDLGTGRTAVQIAAGGYHTMMLLDNGTVKCWGRNNYGQLGYGDTNNRGDNPGEMGDTLPAVDLGTGRTAVQIAAGGYHLAVLLDDGNIICWGANSMGQLGKGNTNSVGDGSGEMGDALLPIDLGTGRTAVQIALGTFHTTAILDNGTVKCWGYNTFGQLGYEDFDNYGDNPGEMGDSLPVVSLGTGRTAVQIETGSYHTIVILDNGAVKCWGNNDSGQLGYGDTDYRGDDPGEMGDNLPVVDL